jgi:hypothetical protein
MAATSPALRKLSCITFLPHKAKLLDEPPFPASLTLEPSTSDLKIIGEFRSPQISGFFLRDRKCLFWTGLEKKPS